MLFGSTSFNKPSRFISELPEETVEKLSERTAHEPPKKIPAGNAAKESFAAQVQRFKGANETKPVSDFSAGDRVSHNVFGEGTVLKVTKMSSDSMLEIAFDKVGTKKIMAAFAKIKKL